MSKSYKNKLITALQPKSMMDFIDTLIFFEVDYVWSIILYQVIVLHVPYEKAGEFFGITKHTIYQRLKAMEKKLNDQKSN